MTSTVTQYSNQINVNFPVAGQDNDSQGFRNNFAKIQNALATADSEITNLQLTSVSLGGANDFGNNLVKRATLQAASDVVNAGGVANVSSGTTVDYALGSYQTFSVSTGSSYTFNVVNWPPTGKAGTVRLELVPIYASGVATGIGSFTVGFGGPVTYLGAVTGPVTHPNADGKTIIWELISPDSGTEKIFAWQLR